MWEIGAFLALAIFGLWFYRHHNFNHKQQRQILQSTRDRVVMTAFAVTILAFGAVVGLLVSFVGEVIRG